MSAIEQNAAEKSPLTHDEGSDLDEDSTSPEEELDEMFDAASIYVEQAVMSGARLFTDDMKLKLYGLYKQATVGPCSTSKPYMWDFKGKAKWSAWHELGAISTADAKGMYVAMVRDVAPKWEPGADGRGPWGPVFSRPADSPEGAPAAEEQPCSSLLDAARVGNSEAATTFVANDPEAIKETDEEGCTALHLAADSGSVAVLQLLLASGADINARDKEGMTALHFGAICEREQVCLLLLEHGADSMLPDNAGDLPAAVGPSTWSIWPS